MTKQNNGWISVEERLPDSGEEVLIYVHNFLGSSFMDIAIICESEYGNIYFEGSNQFIDIEYVTHWQLLPDLPKED